MIKPPLVSIIIPVYNEVKTVKELLTRVYRYKSPLFRTELVIVESNSSDGSRELVRNFVRGKKGITLILERKPKGKGTAVRKGLKAAKGSLFLIQDADLEYDVRDYERVLLPILQKKTEFVLGSRHLNDTNILKWRIRKFKGLGRIYAYLMNFGGFLFHNGFNLLYGTKLTDPTTMYKVFSKKLYKKVKLKGKYFELDWEIVCKFVRLGHIPLEVPIRYNSRSPGEGKKIRPLRDVYRWLYTILKYRLVPINKF